MNLQEDNARNLIIGVDDVSMSYSGKSVLSHASICLYKGDFLAVSGPNGGGKTTLLRIMLKLLRPVSGQVVYYSDGRPVSRLSIGYLPQKSNIDVRFPINVEEVVRSGGLGVFGRKDSARERARYDEVVRLMGIGSYTGRQIGGLSGGQLQRVLLGRALMSDPEVLVLDEPLSYVDKMFERQIYDIMESLARRKTIILVSHEMSVISGMANRHVIVDGRLHECPAGHHYRPSECDEYGLEDSFPPSEMKDC